MVIDRQSAAYLFRLYKPAHQGASLKVFSRPKPHGDDIKSRHFVKDML